MMGGIFVLISMTSISVVIRVKRRKKIQLMSFVKSKNSKFLTAKFMKKN